MGMRRSRSTDCSAFGWRASRVCGLFAAAVAVLVAALGGQATAQQPPNSVDPTPNAQLFASGAMVPFDVGSRFMQRFNTISLFRTAASAANNAQGAGDEPLHERYRAWLEGYGLESVTDSRGNFPGDRRTTYGGIVGAAAMVAPGVSFGLSADQSRSNIGVTGLPQTGRIDLSQVGVNGTFEHGRWALGLTGIYGTGRIRSSRFDAGGESIASYRAKLWGAMAELSYYWSLPGNARLIPKLGFDWMQASTGAFTETGGPTPVSGSSVTSTRMRFLAGAEVGRSWLSDRVLFDVAAYGRLVDNLEQDIGTLTVNLVSGTGIPTAIAGVRESRYGADAGAAISARLSEYFRLYAVYDGRFRGNFTSHSGTLGAEVRW
jgi:uncharacterized protein with beta-barrel porin domain